jgi:predicted DCC family thiol-disulfide oxidoreductase YuxK
VRSTREILVVYDKECPVCDAYCHTVDIPKSVGELRLVNAREDRAVMGDITRRGLDIDQGMVVKADGVLYYGADAIRVLAEMSSPDGLFGGINRWLFTSKRRSEILYPAFRSARNLLLKMLRKTKINNLNFRENSRF